MVIQVENIGRIIGIQQARTAPSVGEMLQSPVKSLPSVGRSSPTLSPIVIKVANMALQPAIMLPSVEIIAVLHRKTARSVGMTAVLHRKIVPSVGISRQ